MAGLVALDLPGGPAFVAALLRVWDRGDAVLPVDQRLPIAARAALLHSMQPTSVLDTTGETALDGGPVEAGDAVVMATSGSTGTPKGVILTHDALTASAASTSRRLGVNDADHWLACLPLAHIGGFSVITKALHRNLPLTVLPGFDTAAVTAAAHNGATLVSLVSTALARIDPALFRVIVLGGGRPPADRPSNTVATYGMTETGSGIVYDGVPLDDVELRIEADGEVLARGPMLMRAYRDGTTAIDNDGWLHTGDLGSWRDDGRVHVEGRRGDLIITGGENVWPETVEAALRTHPDVADAGVAGVVDPQWGQRVVAWVVPAERSAPPDLGALRAHVATTLPGFMAPKQLELIERLPRTALGKLIRSELVTELRD
jgi:o-succinylbenzoate---CoA ligase